VIGFLARQEQFAVVGSTNDVVRDWLTAGTPEVCLAVADEQTAGRGREGRSWVAPAGGALLLSLGFRPAWLAPDRVWRLAAMASLAMAEAAEHVAGLPERAIRLKWPNDLAVETTDGVRKLAGVLGETDGLGGSDPRAIIGLGLNTDWAADDFPPELAGSMTSLREVSSGRSIDHDALLDAFLRRLETGLAALRGGRFDAVAWTDRQLTNGRDVELVAPDGAVTTVRAWGVDADTGALVVEDPSMPWGERQVVVGEIRHVRVPATGIPSAAGSPSGAATGAGV
jgi:BirA family transcriptional regulator, biotin operon repressor / biotin---[acetyl-CoA-carboxylase] ligase